MLRVERSNTILYCDRWPETAAFYRLLLGDVVTFENDWFVELAIGDGSHLSIADVTRATIAPAGGAGLTLSWQVADVETTRRLLVELGIDVTPVIRRFGASAIDVHDPEGHRIELWSAAPAVVEPPG